MIRLGLTAALLPGAGQAQAGQDVPPPRAIHVVQPVLVMAGSPAPFTARIWRETPPVAQGWSPDRYVPVAGLDRMTACEARARIGVMAADGWADRGDDFADAGFGDDDGFPAWEN